MPRGLSPAQPVDAAETGDAKNNKPVDTAVEAARLADAVETGDGTETGNVAEI